MTRRKHSTGLKLFIFLIVAMMLFSAIGIMVIYLNNPNQMMPPAPTFLPSEPGNITIPSITINEGTSEDVDGEIMIGDEDAGENDTGTIENTNNEDVEAVDTGEENSTDNNQ